MTKSSQPKSQFFDIITFQSTNQSSWKIRRARDSPQIDQSKQKKPRTETDITTPSKHHSTELFLSTLKKELNLLEEGFSKQMQTFQEQSHQLIQLMSDQHQDYQSFLKKQNHKLISFVENFISSPEKK